MVEKFREKSFENWLSNSRKANFNFEPSYKVGQIWDSTILLPVLTWKHTGNIHRRIITVFTPDIKNDGNYFPRKMSRRINSMRDRFLVPCNAATPQGITFIMLYLEDHTSSCQISMSGIYLWIVLLESVNKFAFFLNLQYVSVNILSATILFFCFDNNIKRTLLNGSNNIIHNYEHRPTALKNKENNNSCNL